MKEITALARSLEKTLSYNEEAKSRFHRAGKKALKKIAEALGLSPDQYDLRSNKGGIAVSGEITLHTDSLYIQISEPLMGRGNEIMYRSCKGRKDYCGGNNNFMSVSYLVTDFDRAIQAFKSLMKGA